ncbi:DUF4405 domain-containing protein [Dysgonomonas sp. 216]|uniref:DUF4405 domain-containing protein n=1 Tax=Dysgonomonas sp. 216 TaxID=2302934 RepID=UPI0013D45BBF|nr:DUF4405 domain-containing protein [Dysgonomonas sp. 216]NDW17614.1 DUF4405 domain-containing protein [Dysgonomonas sp. 216]
MKLERKVITPYLTFLFVVVAISGMLMLFHIFDDYTKVVHELLGAVFVLFSIFHVILNWKSLKSHFKNKVFIISGIVILLFSTAFVLAGKLHPNHEQIVMEKLAEAPISESFSILKLDYDEVEKILNENDIVIGNSKTIKDIGLNNKKSVKDIIELIIE